MNSNYYQIQITQIEKDIADLYKKIADENQKEINKAKQIESVHKSITKSTPLSSLQTKQNQMKGYQNDILNIKKKIADYQKKIADKNTELGRKKQDLRKAEESERKKTQQEQLDLQRRLQLDIENQKSQLDFLIGRNYSSTTSLAGNDTEDRQKTYDFFISHASEDKNEIVRELADAIKGSGFDVWYDEFELKIGDSLRKKIDLGLANSRYGIVIVSPSFIKKNWTEYELNGMVAREMNGHKVILPIWHKVTKDEVLKFSPSLADKMALNTSLHSIEEIVDRLKEL